MKNKLYFQKQKINWNKNVKEYVARSEFKRTRSRKDRYKKSKSDYIGNLVDFNEPTLSSSLSNILIAPSSKTLKKILYNILATNLILGLSLDSDYLMKDNEEDFKQENLDNIPDSKQSSNTDPEQEF